VKTARSRIGQLVMRRPSQTTPNGALRRTPFFVLGWLGMRCGERAPKPQMRNSGGVNRASWRRYEAGAARIIDIIALSGLIFFIFCNEEILPVGFPRRIFLKRGQPVSTRQPFVFSQTTAMVRFGTGFPFESSDSFDTSIATDLVATNGESF